MGKLLLSLLAIVLIVVAALAAFYLLYYLPLTQDLEDARREASLLAQERSTTRPGSSPSKARSHQERNTRS